MFNWLKKLFGLDIPDTPVITQDAQKSEVKEETKSPMSIKTKTVSTKSTKADLTTMAKKDLLALCKEKGIKANASLKKEELIARLNG